MVLPAELPPAVMVLPAAAAMVLPAAVATALRPEATASSRALLRPASAARRMGTTAALRLATAASPRPRFSGGIIGGVLSAVPVLNILNCCFCMLNLAGAAIGISMFLKENPGNISNGDAAFSGAMSGAIAGLIAGVAQFMWSILLGSILAGLYTSTLPLGAARYIMSMSARGVLGIITDPIWTGCFGALGGFLAMQMFFKDRLLTR